MMLQVQAGIQSVVSQLPTNPVSSDSLRCFVLLPLYKDFMDPKHITNLQMPYAEAVLKLNKEMAEVFSKSGRDVMFVIVIFLFYGKGGRLRTT